MTTEEKLVRENANIIRYCAMDFMNERHMPYSVYYDDVIQEAAIGFLNCYRKSLPHKYIRTSIRYHLYKQFIHQHGIHRNPKRECDVQLVYADDNAVKRANASFKMDDDLAFNIDLDKWMATLTPQDRLVVKMILRGYPPREIELKENIKPGQYNWQRLRIGKSYRAYFGEAG